MAGNAKTEEPKGQGTDTPPKPPKQKLVDGRPTLFTPELGDLICDMLAEGMSLRKVCSNKNMPDKSTVFRWLRVDLDFRDQYARAKEEAADAMAEDILDIADDGSNDVIEVEDRDGNVRKVVDNEVLQRSRLRVDTRKFLMAKMKPKRYGDRITHDGEQTINHRFKELDDEQLDAAITAAKDKIA